MDTKTIKLIYNWKYKNKWPYNGMVDDLYRGIQANENFLVALGIIVYSEAVGGEIIGFRKHGDGCKCFREFTEKYIGYKFPDWGNIYDKVRNGLTHLYGMKAKVSEVNMDLGNLDYGISDKGEKIIIHVHSYFKHFVRGLEKYLDSKNFKIIRLQHNHTVPD